MTEEERKETLNKLIPPNVAIDLDGVLAKIEMTEWEGPYSINDPIEGAVDFTKEIRGLGYTITIHTARIQLIEVKNIPAFHKVLYKWLTDNGFEFDDIHIGPGKPIARLYIDDLGWSCCPETNPNSYQMTLANLKSMMGTKDGDE